MEPAQAVSSNHTEAVIHFSFKLFPFLIISTDSKGERWFPRGQPPICFSQEFWGMKHGFEIRQHSRQKYFYLTLDSDPGFNLELRMLLELGYSS